MDKGVVSVVIPAFNAGPYIRQCLESAFNQTYRATQIVVVDDGSQDDTQELLAPLAEAGCIRYIRQANQGPSAARNRAIENSSGEFVAFLDADDLWLPEKLELQLRLFDNPAVGWVYSDADCFLEDGQLGKDIGFRGYEANLRQYFRRGRLYPLLLDFNFIPSPSVIVRRSVLKETGLFLEKIGAQRFTYGEDYELWMRFAQVSEADFVDRKLVLHRIHLHQLSIDRLRAYRQLSDLYRHLLFCKGFSAKGTIFRKYMENTLKKCVATVIPAWS